MTDGRRTIQANLSWEAAEGWHAFADRCGVSVSAVIEAVAVVLLADAESDVHGELVSRARRVDADRRRRSRPR